MNLNTRLADLILFKSSAHWWQFHLHLTSSVGRLCFPWHFATPAIVDTDKSGILSRRENLAKKIDRLLIIFLRRRPQAHLSCPASFPRPFRSHDSVAQWSSFAYGFREKKKPSKTEIVNLKNNQQGSKTR